MMACSLCGKLTDNYLQCDACKKKFKEAKQNLKKAMTNKATIGDDGDEERLCIHGIGHGKNVHTCDSCCSS